MRAYQCVYSSTTVQYACQIILNLLARPRSLHVPEENTAASKDVYVAVNIYRLQTMPNSNVCSLVRSHQTLGRFYTRLIGGELGSLHLY